MIRKALNDKAKAYKREQEQKAKDEEEQIEADKKFTKAMKEAE